MDKVVFLSFIFPTLVAIIFIKWLLHKPSKTKNLPPSPSRLPILGNLHQTGLLAHRSLHRLAQKHGRFMLLHLGRVPTVVVSSAEAAREVMKTHDLSLADKPNLPAMRRLFYDYKDVFLSPYGEQWRRLKSFTILHLLSNKRVQSFHSIMEEEATILVKKIRECPGVLSLSEMIPKFIHDVVCKSTFGKKCNEMYEGEKFLVLLNEYIELLGNNSVGDFIPWLSWINRVNGLDARVDKVAVEMDAFLEGLLQERMGKTLEGKANDDHEKNTEYFVDILLNHHQTESNDVFIGRDTVKAMLLDILVAGTDSSARVLEWLMCQLLRHPKVMKRLQDEVRVVAKDKDSITHDDTEKMQYLKAVIKETLRTHPPAPITGRIARKEVKLMGYDISAGTMVLLNIWAISMDPNVWEEPKRFDPDRFMNSSLDFKVDFEMIPFGSGRRGCPGISFAMANIEIVLANLVHKFDWTLPEDVKELDMTELPGLGLRRARPLLAIASHL